MDFKQTQVREPSDSNLSSSTHGPYVAPLPISAKEKSVLRMVLEECTYKERALTEEEHHVCQSLVEKGYLYRNSIGVLPYSASHERILKELPTEPPLPEGFRADQTGLYDDKGLLAYARNNKLLGKFDCNSLLCMLLDHWKDYFLSIGVSTSLLEECKRNIWYILYDRTNPMLTVCIYCCGELLGRGPVEFRLDFIPPEFKENMKLRDTDGCEFLQLDLVKHIQDNPASYFALMISDTDFAQMTSVDQIQSLQQLRTLWRRARDWTRTEWE